MTSQPTSQLIPLGQLTPSPTNPRKRFTGIEELAASIKALGMLQAIVARPRFSNADLSCAFEIVAGERRFRAAKLAELDTIPATVRDLSDLDVAVIQAVENEQREDTLPTEKATGYQNLIDQGLTTDQVAERIGKSESHVRWVLNILACPPALREAVDAGKVPPTVAGLVPWVDGEESQETVARCIVEGVTDPAELGQKPEGEERAPLSKREASELIDRHFSKAKPVAPWDEEPPEPKPAAFKYAPPPPRSADYVTTPGTPTEQAAREVGRLAEEACLKEGLAASIKRGLVCKDLGTDWDDLVKSFSPPKGSKAKVKTTKSKPVAEEKPYAFTITAHRGGNQRQFDVIASTVGQARGRATLKLKTGERITSMEPMSQEAYDRVHGAKGRK